MKNRFIRAILAKFLTWSLNIDQEGTREVYLAKAEEVLKGLHSTYIIEFDGNKFDRDMFKILFNIKYSTPEDVLTPYDKLSTYYEFAKEGNNSFLRQPFFRMLRTSKDKEVKKLMHILDRNNR